MIKISRYKIFGVDISFGNCSFQTTKTMQETMVK